MADRFSRGPQQQFQFQATPLNELLAVPMMNQQIYDRNQQAMTEELSRIGSQVVRAEDYNTRKSIVDDLSKKFDDASAKNNGDLAAISDEMYSAIQKQRASGKMTQLADVYKRSEENRQMQDKMRAQGIPFFDKGNAANQALFNADGTMNDLRYETVGYEKSYRPHQEKYFNDIKPSTLGYSEHLKKYGIDPNASMVTVLKTLEKKGVQVPPGMLESATQSYMSSAMGQSQMDMLMNVPGPDGSVMTQDEAEQALRKDMQSAASEVEYSQISRGATKLGGGQSLQTGSQASGNEVYKRPQGSTIKNYGGFNQLMKDLGSKNKAKRDNARVNLSRSKNNFKNQGNKQSQDYNKHLDSQPEYELPDGLNQDQMTYLFKHKNEYIPKSLHGGERAAIMQSSRNGNLDNSQIANFLRENKEYPDTQAGINQMGEDIAMIKKGIYKNRNWYKADSDWMTEIEKYTDESQIQVSNQAQFMLDTDKDKQAKYTDRMRGISSNQWNITGDQEFEDEVGDKFNPNNIERVDGLTPYGAGTVNVTYKDDDGETYQIQLEPKNATYNNEVGLIANDMGPKFKSEFDREIAANKFFPQGENLSGKLKTDKDVMYYIGEAVYVDGNKLTIEDAYDMAMSNNNPQLNMMAIQILESSGAVVRDQNNQLIKNPQLSESQYEEILDGAYVPSNASSTALLLTGL